MPVIDELPELAFDASGLIETSGAAFEEPLASAPATSGVQAYVCPAHPNGDCICHGVLDWDFTPGTEPVAPVEDHVDYSRFENFIPRFVRPDNPCDYCRSKHLNCYLSRGDVGCTACSTLFRECSLSNSQTLEAGNYTNDSNGTFFDTLHSVDELSCRERGNLTGIKTLHSRASGTITPRGGDDAPGSTKRNGIRFPRHAVKILRDWLDVHQHHPYPTEEEKVELEKQTELKPVQIANWLANARRRAKSGGRSRPKVAESPSLRPTTPAIDIPEPEKPWEELNPFERWQHSPPENEPARFTDIFKAVERSDLPEEVEATSPSSYNTRRHKNSSGGGSGWSQKKAQSTTSFETSHPSSLSQSAVSSGANSRGSSHGSYGSFSSSLAGKKDRRRRRRNLTTHARLPTDDKKRIFQCTFCTDTFKSKYDWTRHEKSLHLSLEKWICAPNGPVVRTDRTCVYCNEQNVSAEHGEVHNHSACEEKGFDARTFYRKDHLRQHLRLMHACEMQPSMEAWKSVASNINSRCGFCAQRFTVWQDRVDHLTAHFKAGAKMSQWKGCRGLDPAVAAQVTNAMPPYLIGIEAVSPNPFSATNRNHSNTHAREVAGRAGMQEDVPLVASCNDNDNGTKATCWEILTVRLGKFANEMAGKGIVLTDEMLQSHARKVLYGSDDSWNQTAADNPEWLDLFKKAHGLDFIPSAVGGEGFQIPEDLETYGDLGLRIPFSVQLAVFNQSQAKSKGHLEMSPGADRQAIEQKRSEVRSVYHQLSKEGVLHSADYRCQHSECQGNVVDMRSFEQTPGKDPRTRRWCTYELPISTLTVPTKSGSADATINVAMQGSQGMENGDLRTLGLTTFNEAEQLLNGTGEQIPQNERATAVNSRWNILEKLQKAEVDKCPFTEQNERLGDLRDRQQAAAASDAVARGLDRLVSMESAECVDNWGPNGIPLRSNETSTNNSTSTSPYLRRHKYELPPHRAQRFATVTPAWKDSGLMPPVTYTTSTPDLSLPAIENTGATTSTGAMMEFLGPNIGSGLDFAQSGTSEQIPLYSAQPGRQQQQHSAEYTMLNGNGPAEDALNNWYNGNDHWADESTLLQDLDDLIATYPSADQFGGSTAFEEMRGAESEPPLFDLNASTDGPQQQTWTTDSFAPTPNTSFAQEAAAQGTSTSADVAMEDATFDDLNFDSVFDFDSMVDDPKTGN